MRLSRLHRCFTTSALFGMMALASGCAAKVTERVYVAPTDQTVTARLEAAMDGKGQYVYVENRSTVPVTVTSLHLRDCENIKTRCEVTRMRVKLPPGQRQQIGAVRAANPDAGHNFRYSFTWEAENAAPVISQP